MAASRPLSLPLAMFLLVSLVIASCSPVPSSEPTPTPTRLTPTKAPTSTPKPSPTATHPPTEHALTQLVPLPAGGFSFTPPPVLHADFAPMQATMSNADQTFLFSLAAGNALQDSNIDGALSSFLLNMKQDVPDLEHAAPVQTEVSGQSAISSDIRGTLDGEAFAGRITIVSPAGGLPLYALALAFDPPLGRGWDAEAALYEQVLESLSFFEPTAQSVDCRVSSDRTYGFDEANPVRVGGDAFGGPARERAFLDTLLGPNGEPISYERSGSFSFEDTILDAYLLTYSGIPSPVTIYLDEYTFDTLYAPSGFTCAGSFPVMPP